jgi:hypothetical protein
MSNDSSLPPVDPWEFLPMFLLRQPRPDEGNIERTPQEIKEITAGFANLEAELHARYVNDGVERVAREMLSLLQSMRRRDILDAYRRYAPSKEERIAARRAAMEDAKNVLHYHAVFNF